MRSGIIAAVVIACASLITGCSSAPEDISVETRAGMPDGFDSQSQLLNSPGASWIKGRTQFAIVTFGSSTCPVVPISLEVESPTAMSLVFVESPNEDCKRDLVATTRIFDTPSEIALEGAISVDVTYDLSQDYQYALELK